MVKTIVSRGRWMTKNFQDTTRGGHGVEGRKGRWIDRLWSESCALHHLHCDNSQAPSAGCKLETKQVDHF